MDKQLAILYLGANDHGCTSLHRAKALERLGHRVHHIGRKQIASISNYWLVKFHCRTGFRLYQRSAIRNLEALLSTGQRYDIVWVDSGTWCGPQVVEYLRGFGEKVLLLNLDDPTGRRDKGLWGSLRKAISQFDLCVVVRDQSLREFKERGARQVLKVWRSYDEVAHNPDLAATVERNKYASQVAFIGSRLDDRHQFITDLIEQGIPLSIWGNGWQNGPGWNTIKNHWRGGALADADYVAGIQQAEICLGLLSHGNRDLHTTRSAEIPFAGGLFCAERTSEHCQLYDEGEHAVFWNGSKECAQVCLDLLNDPPRAQRIREQGMRRVRDLGLGNESICRSVITALNS